MEQRARQVEEGFEGGCSLHQVHKRTSVVVAPDPKRGPLVRYGKHAIAISPWRLMGAVASLLHCKRLSAHPLETKL